VCLQLEKVADLVRRMLEPDAMQRISMAEILAHPWYRLGLPAQFASLNNRLLAGR
jgi:serine/threonine protein kinase